MSNHNEGEKSDDHISDSGSFRSQLSGGSHAGILGLRVLTGRSITAGGAAAAAAAAAGIDPDQLLRPSGGAASPHHHQQKQKQQPQPQPAKPNRPYIHPSNPLCRLFRNQSRQQCQFIHWDRPILVLSGLVWCSTPKLDLRVQIRLLLTFSFIFDFLWVKKIVCFFRCPGEKLTAE